MTLMNKSIAWHPPSMKYDKRFLSILYWEALENAPLLTGFMLAARVWSENWVLGFAYLVLGTASGAILIHFTETKKISNQPTPRETLTNFVVFTLLSLPFVFYFAARDAWWSNWVTDIVLGILAGVTLSIGESWGWEDKAPVKLHALSMALSAVLFLSGVRLIFEIESLLLMFVSDLVFILLISLLIVRLEYWPVKVMDNRP